MTHKCTPQAKRLQSGTFPSLKWHLAGEASRSNLRYLWVNERPLENPVFRPNHGRFSKFQGWLPLLRNCLVWSALKKWNLVARQVFFLAQSWYLVENQWKPKKWPKSTKLKIRIWEIGLNGGKYHRLAPGKGILKISYRAHAQSQKTSTP